MPRRLRDHGSELEMGDRQQLCKGVKEADCTDEEAESFIGGAAGGSCRCWSHAACCALGALSVACLAVGGAVLFLQQRGSDIIKPTWEMTHLTIEYINLPGIKGVAPADTSGCPALDPCGVLGAKGCSICPRAEMWNDGCLCRTDAKGGSAPAGQVVQADTSTCPLTDPCGLEASSLNCARCPDDSWISEGCSCRQPPMSASEFFNSVGEFFGAVLGTSDNVIKIGIQAQVEFQNPASVGAIAEPGLFNVTYRGKVIGTATTPETSIAPLGAEQLTASAEVKVILSSQNGMQMMQEALNENQLALDVHGSLLSRSGPFVVQCTIVCHIVTEVSMSPQTKLRRQDCTYGYALLPQL